jgi:hypothetical protein
MNDVHCNQQSVSEANTSNRVRVGASDEETTHAASPTRESI